MYDPSFPSPSPFPGKCSEFSPDQTHLDYDGIIILPFHFFFGSIYYLVVLAYILALSKISAIFGFTGWQIYDHSEITEVVETARKRCIMEIHQNELKNYIFVKDQKGNICVPLENTSQWTVSRVTTMYTYVHDTMFYLHDDTHNTFNHTRSTQTLLTDEALGIPLRNVLCFASSWIDYKDGRERYG